MSDPVEKVREICARFPEVTERTSHGAPSFFVGKQFAAVWADGHHDQQFPHLWVAAPPGSQEELLHTSPDFFRPPYVGPRGWVGVRLEAGVGWDEIAELLEDAYRTVAPARLVAEL